MKFCCTSAVSSKQRKSLKKNNEIKMKKSKDKINHSLLSSTSSSSSSSIFYSQMSFPQVKKYDSGFSETATTISSQYGRETIVEQILSIERIYYQNLKQYILKYSRPLRRYLNPDEIVELFQNIEKISAISESIVRQCEKLCEAENFADLPISVIFQSWSGVMIDSYALFISRTRQAQSALKKSLTQIAYCLQLPSEFIAREITDFIQLPIRHICLLNDLFQSIFNAQPSAMNSLDGKIIEDVRLLARQAQFFLPSPSAVCEATLTTLESSADYGHDVTLETSQNTTIRSEMISTVVLQRTNREPWEPKRVELFNSQLCLTEIDRTDLLSATSSSVPLANVVHIQPDANNEDLRLIVAASPSSSKSTSVKMMRVYLRFQRPDEYRQWFHSLTNAVQQAKDQNWSKTNELVI